MSSLPLSPLRLVPSAAAAAALGAAAWLLTPVEAALGFSTIGGDLSAESQRDFRIHDNFSDPTANNNTTPDPSFPGWLGVEMAMWKGAMEWSSGPHGDGSGDPVHANIGDGGANLDFYWAGNANGVGGTNDNIASQISSCSGGTLAFVEIPIGNGWRMRFCDSAGSWSDGPGAPTVGQGGIDLQGVATHEFGHALGLGHSSVGSAVMAPTTANGMSQRNLDPDDQAGVQFIYGVKSASKPVITSAFVDVAAGTVRILGANFSATNNEVRFTNAGATSTGSDPHLRVNGVSSTNGGTEILVSIPAGAYSGDVMVKQSASGHATLSNGWPVDLVNGGGSGGDPDAKFSAFPTSGSTPLTVAFTDESTGTGINSWDWDFGDGTTSTQSSPSHTYTEAGTYDVTLTVVGANGTDFLTRSDYVVVTLGAGCVDRLGSGLNPDVYSCANDPVLGATWIASVDGRSVGATGLSILVGFAAPLPSPLLTGLGELLVDPTSGAVVSDTASTVNGIALHTLAVPNDSSLEGFVVYSQAFLGGVGVLTNGLDLTLGT